jgi:hypothetical protein
MMLRFEFFVIEVRDRQRDSQNRADKVYYNAMVTVKPTVTGDGKVRLMGWREKCEGRFN